MEMGGARERNGVFVLCEHAIIDIIRGMSPKEHQILHYSYYGPFNRAMVRT
jgi:hypothetical protein